MTGRHGVVWLCRTCRAGAATLAVLRHVAPRAFVNHLWQAALHNGRRSSLVCPSCERPFTEFVDAASALDPEQLEVCTRCFWVWLGPEALASSRGTVVFPPALEDARGARRALGSLTFRALRRVL